MEIEEEKKKKKKSFKERVLTFVKGIPGFFKEVVFVTRLIFLLFFVLIAYILEETPKRSLDKPNRKFNFKKKLRDSYNKFYNKFLQKFDFHEENNIRGSDLIFLALKNLSAKKNRTYVTIGGMALGFGAIILLLSVGYGFERLVVSRVASLAEMKQIDVNITQGTPLTLSADVIDQISEIDGVEVTLPIIESVSKVNYNNAVSDVIIYGVSNRFLEESGISPIEGQIFNDSASNLHSEIEEESHGVVAGATSSLIGKDSYAKEISQVHYSILPLEWKPVYSQPNEDSKIVGYTKREAGEQDAIEVWGTEVKANSGEYYAFDVDGTIYSPWIKSNFLLWEKTLCSINDPDCVDSNFKVIRNLTNQEVGEGYITESNVSIDRYEIYESSYLEIFNGKVIDHISFDVKANDYTYFFFDSSEDSLTSSILDESNNITFNGDLVYGNYYDSAYTSVKDDNGNRYSYWVKSDVNAWREPDCNGVCDIYYTSQKEGFKEGKLEVYFKISDIRIKDLLKENLLSEGVLGESDSTQVASESDPNSSFIDLNNLVGEEGDDIDWVAISSELGTLDSVDKDIKSVPENAQKLALVNTSMLDLLGISCNEAIGETFESTVVFDSSLFNKTNYIVESEPIDFEVLGIVSDSKTPTFYVSFGDLLVDGVENVSQLKVIVNNQNNVSDVRASIESMGFKTASIVDTVDRISSLFSYLRMGLLILGLIALGVASLGMFNTLTVSLLEKTREVGLLKTMGLRSKEVKILFLAESIIMSVFGGGAGLVLGFVIGKLIGLLISVLAIVQGQGYVDITYIPVVLAIAMVVGSAIIGVLTGWYPSKRATEVSALDALRYE